jgi:hypothetical protein
MVSYQHEVAMRVTLRVWPRRTKLVFSAGPCVDREGRPCHRLLGVRRRSAR